MTEPLESMTGAATAERGATIARKDREAVFELEGVTVSYAGVPAVRDIGFPIYRNQITALIGPSGCGKSTLIRCLNRMNDLIPSARVEGKVLYHGEDLYAPQVDPLEVRIRISMVFQKANPFPKSIYENVAYGLRIRGTSGRQVLDAKVEEALRGAALWKEVKDRLHENGMSLSGGQQQRLCIARALATDPEMLLFDEPTSALDPQSTDRIEELMTTLRERVTILVVTHNMQQAARISDYTALMYLGELVEFDRTDLVFTRPAKKMTEDYVTGRFG